MRTLFSIATLITLVTGQLALAELELPTASPTTSFLAPEAKLVAVAKDWDTVQLTFTGRLVSTDKGVQPQLDKEDSHRLSIVCDSQDEKGSFVLFAESLAGLVGKPCAIDATTGSFRMTGSGIHLAYSNSRFVIKGR